MAKWHAAKREEIVETIRVVVGYRQTCAVCGVRFESLKPAETCSDTCKQRRKRARRAARSDV